MRRFIGERFNPFGDWADRITDGVEEVWVLLEDADDCQEGSARCSKESGVLSSCEVDFESSLFIKGAERFEQSNLPISHGALAP